MRATSLSRLTLPNLRRDLEPLLEGEISAASKVAGRSGMKTSQSSELLRKPNRAMPLFYRGDAIECFFFAPERFLDRGLLCPQLGKHVAQRADQNVDQLKKERLVKAQGPTIAHRAAQDAPQDVTTAFVARLNAVRDGKAEGTNVVGDNTKCDIAFLLVVLTRAAGFRKRGTVTLAAQFFDFIKDRAENVGLVVRERARKSR